MKPQKDGQSIPDLNQPGHRLSTLEIIDYPGLDHVYNVLISFYGFTM